MATFRRGRSTPRLSVAERLQSIGTEFVRNLLAIFLMVAATAQPALCCCPEPETTLCDNCLDSGDVDSGATSYWTCNCHGQHDGCGCEGHPCASTQPKSVTRENANYPSKHAVIAFQPAGGWMLFHAPSHYVADNTDSTQLSKCRTHLLFGHLVI